MISSRNTIKEIDDNLYIPRRYYAKLRHIAEYKFEAEYSQVRYTARHLEECALNELYQQSIDAWHIMANREWQLVTEKIRVTKRIQSDILAILEIQPTTEAELVTLLTSHDVDTIKLNLNRLKKEILFKKINYCILKSSKIIYCHSCQIDLLKNVVERIPVFVRALAILTTEWCNSRPLI